MSENTSSKIKSANRGMPIEKLLSAPMTAASKANAMLSREQANFILDYCFSYKDGVYRPVMINMALTRSIIDATESVNETGKVKQIVTYFHLPLITIVPLSSLSVNDVEVDFELEITSMESGSISESIEGSKNKKGDNLTLIGGLSYDSKEPVSYEGKRQYSRRNRAKISVSMKAGPLPLPLGVSSIIDLYSKNINPQGQPSYLKDADKK
ncbi:MAG: DUF2589 domain-containing protein [Marinilabiliaceae bacterium]|nr:DUF2589 domain-containing protein [Marinilabiliaceae bacterium]